MILLARCGFREELEQLKSAMIHQVQVQELDVIGTGQLGWSKNTIAIRRYISRPLGHLVEYISRTTD